jgi:carboxymethylenebutenolidase
MNLKFATLSICLAFLVTHHGNGQESRLLSKPGMNPEVHGALMKPETPGTYPAVIILYGSSGLRPLYVTMGKQIADSGFVVLLLDYFAVSKGDPDMLNPVEELPNWQAALRNAVTLLKEDPSTGGEPVGLLGYSLGGFLAVSTANSIPEVKAVVEFFGGAVDELDLESQVRNFPPLLILHGDKDESVPVSKAYELRDGVMDQGGEVEMIIYPGAPHGFNAPWAPWYNDSLANDSFQRTVDFFQRKLSK